MAELTIRPLSQHDLEAWLELEQQSFSDAWSLTQLEALMQRPRHLCMGAFEGERLLGYSVLSWVLDEAELLRIAVDPACRGRRLAQHLFEGAVQILRAQQGIGRVMLEVRASNRAAIALYARLGFIEDGVRRGYYVDANGTEDGLLMSLWWHAADNADTGQ